MSNRKLKFRVYIPEQGKFIYFGLNEFDYSDRYLYQNEYPVQQFIGSKDINGFDIYEGDLLEFSYKDDGKSFIGKVEYSETYACFIVSMDKVFETFSDLLKYAYSIRIVGNIIEDEN
jgi:hypothetical protein